MSEIKITKNSIENSIISNGQVTIGSIGNTDSGKSNIVSNSLGSMAIGYIDGTIDNSVGASISATGLGSFASGYAFVQSISSDKEKMLEYHNVIANGYGTHAEGCGTYAGELYAHAEGYDTRANGNGTHAEGCGTYAGMQLVNTEAKVAERYADNAIKLTESIAEQLNGKRVFINIHIYNVKNIVDDDIIVFEENISDEDLEWATKNCIFEIDKAGNYAHAEGYYTTATGTGAHAEGYYTTATGMYSHAGGYGTIANTIAMTAIGRYNSTNVENTLFVVGDGLGRENVNRSDAFRVNSLGSNKTNSVPSSVQAKVNGVSDVYLGCPIGTIVMWAGQTTPDGWFVCNGDDILITSNKIPIEQPIQNIEFEEGELQKIVDVLIDEYGVCILKIYDQYAKDVSIDEEHKKIIVTDSTNNLNDAFRFNVEINEDEYNVNDGQDKVDAINYDFQYRCDLPDLQQKFPLDTIDFIIKYK